MFVENESILNNKIIYGNTYIIVTMVWHLNLLEKMSCVSLFLLFITRYILNYIGDYKIIVCEEMIIIIIT